MKITIKILLVLIVFIFGVTKVFADVPTEPPAPMTNANGAPVVTPPGLPIDENIPLFVIIAILLGLYIIYNHNLKTKTPI